MSVPRHKNRTMTAFQRCAFSVQALNGTMKINLSSLSLSESSALVASLLDLVASVQSHRDKLTSASPLPTRDVQWDREPLEGGLG